MATKKHANLNKFLIAIETSVICGFLLLHMTPGMAVRTVLITNGYFKSAMTAKIVKTNENPDGIGTAKRNSNDGTVYYVEPSPVSKEKNIRMNPHPNRMIVKTFGLSFAEMTGEG
ncbi:hypothetical protein [Lacticaseibacillus hulanensis]|uniref:hypothetical protein n=1 Tax=Lacticaseibacillus hulanensis TaxID=2493111 RepID=UPI000FD92D79|nr:hypothetical protein [Lacticaseibacillus hulanensis]